MNEELQKVLMGIINKTVEVTGEATNFLTAEIPEVVEQLLMWKMAESLMGVVLGFICGIIFLIIAIKSSKKWPNPMDEVTPLPLFLIIISYILSGLIPLCNWNITWLQIWVAPKVYLIEYVASLATK